MKVYIMTEGSFDDYRILTVFLDKTKAEEYKKYYECDMEEYESSDDTFNIDKSKLKKYLVVSYNFDAQNNNENIEFNVNETNIDIYPDLDKYPYNYKKYRYSDSNKIHSINLNILVDYNFKINDKMKEEFLKICKDYITQAKLLHLATGIHYNNLDNILFR